MTYQDFLHAQGLQTPINTDVPGLQPPVQFVPIPGTTQSPQQILAQQFQDARNQQVLSQQATDTATATQAQAAAQAKAEEERKRHRGGGFFSPITRAYNALVDYPQTFGAALGNVASHPFSLGAYGQAAMAFAGPIAAFGGVPQDYTKMGIGTILYHAAKGDVRWFAEITGALMTINPMVGSLPAIGAALYLALSHEQKQAIIHANDEGYKDFSGGNGVWEYMQSALDDLPDVVRYPLRAVVDIGVDPLTYIGIGAAGDAAKLAGKGANLERGAELAAMSPGERIGQALKSTGSTSSKIRDVVIPQGVNPVREIDRAFRATSLPFDMALGGIGKSGRYLANRSELLGGLGEMTTRKAAEKLSREQMWSATRMGRFLQRETPDGEEALVKAAPGFATTSSVDATTGERVYTLTSANDQQLISEIRVDPENNVRLITPDNPAGAPMPSLPAAVAEARAHDVAYAKTVRNTYDSNPPPRIRLLEHRPDLFEVQHETRGSAYAQQHPDTKAWELFDRNGDPLDIAHADPRQVYDEAVRHVLGQDYPHTTLANGTEVGPSFGFNPKGGRPQDLVGTIHQGDPRADLFHERLGADLPPMSDIIRTEDERVRQQTTSPQRRDLNAEEASAQGRPRTLDSFAKTLAEVKGTLLGQHHYRSIFGDPKVPFPRTWSEDSARIIRAWQRGELKGRPQIQFQINTREAIKQALFTKSREDAETIIQFFEHRRDLVPKEYVEQLLLFPEQSQEFLKRAKGKSVNVGRLLRANREAIDEVFAGRPLTAVPPELMTATHALPAGDLPTPEAPPIAPPPAPMTFADQTDRFVPPPEGPAPVPPAGQEAQSSFLQAAPVDPLKTKMEDLSNEIEALSTEEVTGKNAKGSVAKRERLRVARQELADLEQQARAAAPVAGPPVAEPPVAGEAPQLRAPRGVGGAAEPVTFTTSKGSTYTVNPDGTTTRNKSLHPEHGPEDVGIKPPSEQTVYASPADKMKLGAWQVAGEGKKQAVLSEDGSQLGFKFLEGPNAGKIDQHNVVDVTTTPEVGKIPVELWDDGGTVHFGNEITEVRGGTAAPTGTSSFQQLVDAGDDPVKRQQASDALVQDVTKSTPKRIDPQASGHSTYLVRGDAGAPEVSVHIGDDNSITVTALDPEDPEVRNIVARAGTDTPVTVKQGMPDEIGTPDGLTTPATVDESGNMLDPVYRWKMLDNGVTDEDVANMTRVIEVKKPNGETPSGKPKFITTNMRAADYYLLMLGETRDPAEALKALASAIRDANLPAKDKEEWLDRILSKRAVRKWDSFINHQRDVLMFNWATGAPAGFLDHIGDAFRMATKGYGREALRVSTPDVGAIALGIRENRPKDIIKGFVPEQARAAWHETEGDLNAMMGTPDMRTLTKIGIEITPNTDLGIGHQIESTGREEAVRGKGTQLMRSLEKRNVSPKTARKISQAAGTILMDGSEFMMKMRSAGDLARRVAVFSGAITRALPKAREDFLQVAEHYASQWPEFNLQYFDSHLGEAFSPNEARIVAMESGLDAGKAEQLRRSWTNKVGELERHGAQQVDEVLFSYEHNRADEVLKRIFLFHYWYTRATVNYTRTIIANPYLYTNYDRAMKAMDRASEGQPSTVRGLIKAFTGPGGFSILMDPFKAITTAVDFRQKAFQDGEGTAFDSFMAQSGLFLNPALQAAAAFLGWAQNDNVDPFATFQMRRIFGAGANLVNADTGGGMLGAPYQQAMNDAIEKGSSFWSQILPGSQTRYARDAKANDKVLIRNAILDRVIADLGIDPNADFGQWTPEQIQTLEAAYDALDHGTSNPYTDAAYRDWAHSNALRTGLSMTAPVGTAMRSETRDARSNAARRFEDPVTGEMLAPPGSMAAQQQRDIPAAQSGIPTNLAISDAQFDALFPSNQAGRVSVSADGQTQDQVLGQSQNAAYAAYRQWKGTVDDKHAFRVQMEQVSPAYRLYMDDLRQTEPFASDEAAQDNAGVSFGAYIVLNGDKGNMYDRNNPPVLDPTAINPAALFGQATGAGSYGTGPQTTNDLAGYIAAQLMSYQDDQKAFQAAATKMFGQTIQLDMISPMAQRYIRNELSKFGIRVPQLGDAASGYQAWARVQPMGADTSIEAYIRSLGNRIPLTQSPQQLTM